mmetsp:Transcript_11691/g.24686  ORF Transcript_11691/g.24686 Transcript_11691/m.24686 type:complete len:249 (+) Transcript_11691:1909-2655(+)
MVLPEDARPRHHEEALLEEDLPAKPVLEVPAFQRQRPGLGVRPARLQRAVAAHLLAENEILTSCQRGSPSPFLGHLIDNTPRGRVPQAICNALLRGHPMRKGIRHRGRHPAQVLVWVHEGFVWFLIDDEGIHLVENQHTTLVAVEVSLLPPRDACVEGLHVLGLAIADVSVGVHTGYHRGLPAAHRREALLRDADNRGEVPPLSASSGGGHLKDVKEALEHVKVSLQQSLIVHDDVRLLAEDNDHVDG